MSNKKVVITAKQKDAIYTQARIDPKRKFYHFWLTGDGPGDFEGGWCDTIPDNDFRCTHVFYNRTGQIYNAEYARRNLRFFI